jgi:sphingosine kinase
MVDLDIGTEHMRWMGDTRFLLGFLKGVAANKNFQCRLRMKVVESDKVSMARKARERSQEQVEAQRNGAVGAVTNGAPKSKPNGQEKANGLVEAVNGLKVEDEQEGEEKKGEEKKGDEQKKEEQTGLEPGPSSGLDIAPTMNGNGNNHVNEHDGPLSEAKPLEPDDTWLTIESASKKPQVMSKGKGPVNGDVDKTGGWVDGEGILYM